MKKLKAGFLALALIAGVMGAFVSKTQAKTKFVDATYHWQKYLSDGITRDAINDEVATIAVAQSDYFDCSGSGNRCAAGTKDVGTGDGPSTLTLKYP